MRGKKTGRSKKVLLSLILLGVIIGAALSFATAVMVKKTSDDEFCAKCHTMQPMIDSYHQDVHGGKGQLGIKAKCVDCHLPHDSLANYMVAKAKTGIHDAVAELTYDKSKIDWQGKRKHAKTFVYDSGCLECHGNLQEATMANHKAFIAHKAYFLEGRETCVECHMNVGHHNLGDYISRNNNPSNNKANSK